MILRIHRRRSCEFRSWFAAAGALVLACGLSAGAAEPAKGGGKPAAAVPPPEALKVLEENGLKIVGINLTLAGEAELVKMSTEITKLKKALIGAERELRGAESDVGEIGDQLGALKAQDLELNAGLSQVTNTLQNNQIVGTLNALNRQMELIAEQQKTATKRLKEVMAKTSDVRESYVEHLLKMRAKADEISEQWTKLADDADLQTAVEAINEATGKKFKVAPTSSFVSAEKKLQTLEHTVLSEAIPLADEDGGLEVNVTIDGKHRCKMQVDSGATSVCLPYKMASDMGMEPKSSDPKIICVLADGSQVPGTRVKISSVRVGKFTVEDVDCVVFDAKAVNASPLLGMSYLGNFKFEIDKQKSELRMVKVDSGDSPAKGKAGPKSKPGSPPKAATTPKSKKSKGDSGE
jgi:clan AA aspartic protease (TIGR02281 family)